MNIATTNVYIYLINYQVHQGALLAASMNRLSTNCWYYWNNFMFTCLCHEFVCSHWRVKNKRIPCEYRGRLRGLTVACWITDHYHLCSNLGVGIRFISIGGRSAHLAYHVHKSRRKTPIIISPLCSCVLTGLWTCTFWRTNQRTRQYVLTNCSVLGT